MKKSSILFILLSVFLLASPTFAATQTVEESHTYVMGDNDSKNDARQMCFLEAKRKILERAGTLVLSHTQVKSGTLTKDEINSYTAALMKVETVSQRWSINGSGSMTVTMKVRSKIDMDDINKRLNAIQQDSSVQMQIQEQQQSLAALEKYVGSLQKQLGGSNPVESLLLRKERNVVFGEIDNLQAKKVAIMRSIAAAGNRAKSLVKKNMTRREVRLLAGEPRARGIEFCKVEGATSTGVVHSMNYGETWVLFKDDLVLCTSKGRPSDVCCP